MTSQQASESTLSAAENASSLFISELIKLCQIPSVSFPGFDKTHIEQACTSIENLFKQLSGVRVERLTLEGANPAVLISAQTIEPNQPTILMYAHYDVQPPLQESKWNSPPFAPEVRGDRLYGRGCADDKAGVILHFATLYSFLSSGNSLPVNIKILLEGEEEIGSPNLGKLIETYRDQLVADCVIIADCTNHATGLPSLTTSLRGLVSMDIKLKSMSSALHSGMWGGPIPDPAMELCKLLASLTDGDGNIAIPEIREMIPKLSTKEINQLREIPIDLDVFRLQAGLLPNTQILRDAKSVHESLWRKPVLVVTAITGGQGINTGNVLLGDAWCRLGLRLPPGMDAARCQNILINFLKKRVPHGLTLEIETEKGASGWQTNTSHPVFSVVEMAMEQGYGKKPIYIGCGGSIPFVGQLCAELGGIPALLTGLEDPDTLAHSENESLYLPDFFHALKSQIIFLGFLQGQKSIFEIGV